MSKHKHGSMDISNQEAVFEGFIAWSIRITVLSIAVLVFLAVFNS